MLVQLDKDTLIINTTSTEAYSTFNADNRPFIYSTKEPGSSIISIHFCTRGSIEWR